jgi:hypothetical protein
MITTRDKHVAQAFKSLKLLNKSRNDVFSCKFQLAVLFVLESHVAVRVVATLAATFTTRRQSRQYYLSHTHFKMITNHFFRVGIPTKRVIT